VKHGQKCQATVDRHPSGRGSPDDHLFLRGACKKFVIWYRGPGNGVSHPVHWSVSAYPARRCWAGQPYLRRLARNVGDRRRRPGGRLAMAGQDSSREHAAIAPRYLEAPRGALRPRAPDAPYDVRCFLRSRNSPSTGISFSASSGKRSQSIPSGAAGGWCTSITSSGVTITETGKSCSSVADGPGVRPSPDRVRETLSTG
jgi:hypothetical protein